MFLVRTAFWLSIVVLLIPADAETGEQAPRVSALEALSAARSTVNDLSQFCDRNPDVCVTGGSAFHVFADKMRTGVKLLYGYFSDDKVGTDPPSANTLAPEDLEPAWQEPAPDGPA